MSNVGSFGGFFCNFDFQNCLFFTCRNLKFFGQIIYLPKLCNKKLKLKFVQKFWSFGQKTTVKISVFPVHISVTIHCRITGFFCSVSKDVSIVFNVRVIFLKCQMLVVLEFFFAILISKIVFFLHVEF